MRVRQHTRVLISRVTPPSPSQLSSDARRLHGFTVMAVLGVLLSTLSLPTAEVAQSTDSAGSGTGLQLAQPVEPGQASPHVTITLQDALDRAEKIDAQYSAAVTDAKMAKEDHVQARAAGLPSLGLQTSALLTQGNGAISTGRYVTNDGVHVYRQWGVVHQDFSPSTLTMLGDRKGAALEALARAKAEIARRGLKVTVTKDYYALVVSERKFATAQEAMKQSANFLTMTKEQERQGEAAHSDVIKAQIQSNQQQAILQDAQLQMEDDRLTLGVLLFPTLTENFSVVDDLDQGQSLPFL
jgi:outer membrane protein TolC